MITGTKGSVLEDQNPPHTKISKGFEPGYLGLRSDVFLTLQNEQSPQDQFDFH